MDEEKKAKVISMFAEMAKKTDRPVRQKGMRKAAASAASGTQIINSTIVVCGDGFHDVVAKLFESKQHRR